MSAPKPHAASTAEPSGAYVLEDQIGYLLRRAHQRATAVFIERMAPDTLTPTQFAALVKLAELGPVSQNHLGRTIAMDPATSQGVVRRLVEQGYVQRADDATDRRRAVLSLTAEGQSLVARCRPRGFDVSAAVLEPLAPDERAQFLAQLKRLA